MMANLISKIYSTDQKYQKMKKPKKDQKKIGRSKED
jgi:hypothetical protein